MDIGSTIRNCRIQKKMNQTELAKLSGISESYLSLIERGKRDPNLSVLERITKSLNIPLSILAFLAADKEELKDISEPLAEKLSYTALRLMREPNNS